MQYDSRDLRSGLKSKGFQITSEGDHYFANFLFDGVIETSVKSKVGGYSKVKYKALHDELLSRIQKSLHFDNVRQLIDYAECDMIQEEYQKMLLKKGKIEIPPKTE
ncbi:hypothetical protein ES703_63562 [subsurface metagenome]